MAIATALARGSEGTSGNPFELISRRAESCNAINLGQGLPEFGWTDDLIEAARTALVRESNQYPPSAGLPVLRSAVARHYRRHQLLDYEASDVVITSGGTEALAATILGIVRPGDEVILVEPFYGAYLPLVERAGGIARTLRLEPPHFRLDPEAIANCVTSRTRMLILNNPLNPFGVVLDSEVLDIVAQICCAHDIVAVSDEVWEHALVLPRRFRSLVSLPGMRDRTVKIGAGGKIFSLTGWKVGWTCSGAELATKIEQAHSNLTFATSPHLQRAIAYGLDREDSYFAHMRQELMTAANYMRRGLIRLGFDVLPSTATHFMNVDLRRSGTSVDDVTFCARLLDDWGVAAVPVSTFYRSNAPVQFVRFCYSKNIATLDAAFPRLGAALDHFQEANPIAAGDTR